MNRHSLFKVQSLVAIALCTSLSAWASPDKKEMEPVEAKQTNLNLTPEQLKQAKNMCADSKYNSLSESTCLDLIDSSSTIITNDGASQRCSAATDRENQKQSEANSQQSSYYSAVENKLNAVANAEKAKIQAQTQVANAQTQYNTAVTNINLSLPNQTQQIRDAAAKQLLDLKQKMIAIGQKIIEADNMLRAAQTAIEDAASDMQANCATFAGTKANAKLKEFDDAMKAVKGAQNTYVNYSSTNVAGAKNRRNAKRARDAQAAYISAYSSCMSGKTDPNGGEVGPGPQLLAALTKAQNALPKAQEIYKQQMALIEMEKQNLMEQMEQSEKSMNTAIQMAMTAAQSQINQAYAQLQQTIASANGQVASESVELNIKGGLWDQQAQSAAQQAQNAIAQAQTASANALQACGNTASGAGQIQQMQNIFNGVRAVK